MRLRRCAVRCERRDGNRNAIVCQSVRLGLITTLVALAPFASAKADESGVSFWLPGFFGSLAATPQQPGWTLGTIYYHASYTGGGAVATSRAITIGEFNPTLNLGLNGSLKATGDVGLIAPGYVFQSPFLGAQAAVSLAATYGRASANLNATIFGSLGPLPFSRSLDLGDTVSDFGDLLPQFSLRWNAGVNNWMTYITGDVPIGSYDQHRLANVGIGHGAIDAGGGYTYFDPQAGHEFSATLGFTYNLENVHTQYQNGIDMHLDLGASQFVMKQWQLGAVGYFYDQISCDHGAGDRIGCFESRVAGLGPQVGYIIPLGEYQGYVNVKGYKEFAADNRPHGWDVWLTFAISTAPPNETAAKMAAVHK